MFLCHYHRVFITIALQWNLFPGKACRPSLFLFSKFTLALSMHFLFLMNVGISLLFLRAATCWLLGKDWTKFIINMERMDSLQDYTFPSRNKITICPRPLLWSLVKFYGILNLDFAHFFLSLLLSFYSFVYGICSAFYYRKSQEEKLLAVNT